MALSSPILRKLRQFSNVLLLPMSKNCKCSLVYVTIIVALYTILQTLLPLLKLFLKKRLFFHWSNTKESAMHSLCTALYSCIMFLLYQTLPNHSKFRVMHLILIQMVYLHRSIYLFISQFLSSATCLPVVRKKTSLD